MVVAFDDKAVPGILCPSRRKRLKAKKILPSALTCANAECQRLSYSTCNQFIISLLLYGANKFINL